MQDFVVQCLIKDYQLRPSTDLLLKHEFLRLPSEKNVRNQMREHTDSRRKKVRRTSPRTLVVPCNFLYRCNCKTLSYDLACTVV